MSNNNRHDRDWWVSTVENLRSSQSNLQEFSESVGVHPATLGWWRRKLAREPAVASVPLATSTMVRVELAPAPIAAVVQRLPVRVIEAAVGAVAIRFEVGTDTAYRVELICTIVGAVQSC